MAVVISTTFLKLAIVMSLLRNALGIQQIPPNIALYSLALILTLYIMAPVGDRMLEAFRAEPKATQNLESLIGAVRKGAEPLRGFLLKNSKGEQRDFFVRTSKRLWTEEMVEQRSPGRLPGADPGLRRDRAHQRVPDRLPALPAFRGDRPGDLQHPARHGDDDGLAGHDLAAAQALPVRPGRRLDPAHPGPGAELRIGERRWIPST
jgi:hypothetical protein